ncbi:hypothetical protein AMD27_12110 [Acinetobacter sp. TGL-Y2]|uniref:hypothetical protein n=1 Tax=Acinetobacter sp. TGL-Y2 TaxID=1407071 RepID=UPI0007A65155|nr:hypothetical protein [Acinetobacter sp. TGL-Y2]AMW79553.1 hypothetical protein AMD27_12110 [Acinetobacter sp. TGL-Y2]
MTNTQSRGVLDQIQTEELQHLITVSTGFIDAYIIECHQTVPMLLPQNIVLSALNSPSHVQSIEWHEHNLPVFHVNNPVQRAGVALVIEGEAVDQRFALMCDSMPSSIRIRISEVVDEDHPLEDPSILQYVRLNDALYYVPAIEYIQKSIGLNVEA